MKNGIKEIFRGAFLYAHIVIEKIRGIDFSIPIYHSEKNHVQTMSSTDLVIPVLKKFLLDERIQRSDAIIDVGCGKGRMVYFFSKMGFGRIGGLEYSKEVFDVLCNNINVLYSGKTIRKSYDRNTTRCNFEALKDKAENDGNSEIEFEKFGGGIFLINADAKFYDEFDEYNYFYLFNPFHNDIMDGFIKNLEKSLNRHHRMITIIYFNPVDVKSFLNNGFEITDRLKHNILILRKSKSENPTYKW